MKFWIGVTSNEWFAFLAARQPDEVNFWQPSGGAFRAIEPGAPFLFKLHSPQNYIVGGGFFVRYSLLPISLAWTVFGTKNGAPDFTSFRDSIMRYRGRNDPLERDPVIGCAVLTSPFFFNQNDWIPQPRDWSPNIVRGKTYDTDEPIGAHIWEAVSLRLTLSRLVPVEQTKDAVWTLEQQGRYGPAYPFRPRLGQGAFRVAVTEAYQRRCAVTGERTLPVLEAAHIKPYAESGPHALGNGLLLRSDLHILFDRGYMTVTDGYRVEVSRAIKDEYENGRDYYALHGQSLQSMPDVVQEQPSPEFVRWHNEHVYRG